MAGAPQAAADTRASRGLVTSVFADEVRAEQAVSALEVWRRADRRLGVGPIGVVGRRVSGTVTSRTRGVVRPGRGALGGLVVGAILLGLPAAGAGWLLAWTLGSIAFGLAGLVGAIPSGQVGFLTLAVAAGAAGLAALLWGLVGGLIGCLVGFLVGLIDTAARGMSRTDLAQTLAGMSPGTWAAVVRVQPAAAPLVGEELTRLGGTLATALDGAPPALAAAQDTAAARKG